MSLAQVLNARSVAIVGASKNPTKRGFQAIKTLLEEHFEGQIYPINPREESVLGLRCYPSVSAIEGDCDLALITTPAPTLPAILEDCGRKGVAGAVVIAGGFGEVGSSGRALEDEMVATARQHGIRIIGPNTSGMINLHRNLDLVGLGQVRRGPIALLSQSGNMALTLMTEGTIKSQKGFSYYVGVGNEADIQFHEYLEFFQEDEQTRAILMYVEGMRDGRQFLQQAYATTRKKPIIMLKSGRSAKGAQSVGSHTGALAGISEVARSAFKRAGIIVVESSDELFPVAETLASLPRVRHNNVAILADGGGHATIAADYLSSLGVEMPQLSDKTQARLREILPAAASVRNPIDVAGGADANPSIFAECLKILINDHQVGGVLVVGLFGGYSIRFSKSLEFVEEDAAHQMGKLVRDIGKPIVVHSLYNYARPHSLDLLRYYNIPVYDSVEVACKCIGALAERGEHLASYEAKTSFELHWGLKAKPRGQEIIAQAIAEGRTSLLEPEAKELLGLHGATMSPGVLATTADEATTAAADIGGPVAMKIVSPQIVHKSDAGGVMLNVHGNGSVRKAFNALIASAKRYDSQAAILGVLVSPMASPGLEAIVGTKIDSQFGPVILFGIGGIMVEVLKDVSFRVLPISSYSAKMMIDDIKGKALLNGFRGKPAVDKKALRKLLTIVGEVMEAYPEIAEMDLNPVIVYQEGLVVVDARVLLKHDTDDYPGRISQIEWAPPPSK
jgi:acetate---CoA ligase (ADP-forming)